VDGSWIGRHRCSICSFLLCCYERKETGGSNGKGCKYRNLIKSGTRILQSLIFFQVSSKSGWSPDPDIWARRKFKELNGHWFPEDDPSGPRKSVKPTLCTEDLNI